MRKGGLVFRLQANSVAAKVAVTHQPPTALPASGSFYRPELDVIRFVALFAVFVFHAPRIPALSRLKLDRVEEAGSYGLPLFFFLSAFLITELLLREQQQSGTIHMKAFYIRRSLRIWPLYILGVLTAILWSHFATEYRLTYNQIYFLISLFLGYMGREYNNNPAGVLWSVSVEEIFYLIWPIAGKLSAFWWASLALLIVSVTTFLSTGDVWYNPLSQSFYFALGGFLALMTHRLPANISSASRVALLTLSAGSFLLGSELKIWPLRFVFGGIGCVFVVIGFLGINPKWIPAPLVYLGKISYGLYVFHLSCLVLVKMWFDKLNLSVGSSWKSLTIQVAAFIMCTGIAALSYRYFETPFLKLKRRFEFIKSRPV